MKNQARMIKSHDGNKLAIVNPNAAGIDIADTEMQVCVPEDRDGENNRRFGSFTQDLNTIVDWLKDCRITTVAMEATGIYYLSLFLKLQDAGIDVLLANPQDVKNLSGRKTDAADAEWLMVLHRYGLLKPCYQPGNAARQIRNLTRQRSNLIRMAEKEVQYMQKAMEQMNIKLSTVISDITGLSGRKIITAILDGQRDTYALASLAESNCKASREEIALSLEGTWDEDLLFMLKQSLDAYDFFLSQVSDCDTEIEKLLSLYGARIDSANAELVRCKRKKSRSKNAPKMDIENFAYQLWGVNVFEIPGLKDTAVMHLIGELGHDFIDKFESAEKFSSWCNLAPNNKISGGKILSSKIMKRKNPVGQIFRTAAAPLARDKGEMGNYYRRMKAKSGALQANVATAHKMAKIFYTMVKNKVAYDASKVGLNERELTERKIAKLERALMRLKNAS
ncbi:MAG: IS110 family transposase [Bacteroidales bacterium]|nr:IS110 family transposase [Bacteroidales bacterium]MBQ8811427.1 IS110 family transposase [Bacteroidales bacterium]